MRNLVFILFLSGIVNYINAQNLVPNPGFEDYRCSSYYISAIESVKEWSNPTMSSPDYFNNACKDKNFGTIPSKYYGGQHCYNGSAYAGFIACFNHEKLKQQDPGAEYIQVKLNEPLEQGARYLVKADFSLAECSKAAVKEIGFYFSPDEVKTRSVGLLPYKAQLKTNCNLKDTSKWVTSLNYFIAEGNERYLLIGCFKEKRLPEMESVRPSSAILDTRDYAYYFIDNVEVIKQKDDMPGLKAE